MADDANNNLNNPFDVPTIRNLVALMSKHDLSEIDLRRGDQRIRLRRGPAVGPVATPSLILPAATPAPAAPPAAPQAPPAPAEKPGRVLQEIKSEVVGTFYNRPNPESPPFVNVGARVAPDTVVGLIEAMKLFNDVVAGCSGVVAEILVENQQPVEFGQVLFKVDPAA